jgi:pimeloyl-ACP methyl ester carboxylesterase
MPYSDFDRFGKAAAAIACWCSFLLSANAVTPPSQPASGPGGAGYPYDRVDTLVRGTGTLQYWLFTPNTSGAGGPPASAPVIAFFHGYNALDPETYQAWIDHLVKRGAIVIFPKFQINAASPPAQYTADSIAAIKDALDFIATRGTAPLADVARFACIGHSIGGLTAASVAATGPGQGLPICRALMCAQSGKSTAWGPPFGVFPLADLSLLSPGTLLLSVVGEDDQLTFDTDSRRIFWESTRIPFADKNFIIVHSDSEDGTTLSADHGSPATGTGPNALDYYAYWKLSSALVSAAFYGADRQYALGNTPDQRFMGNWSNGRPVKELTIFDLRQPLEILADPVTVELRWPYIMDGWTLESSSNLGAGSWVPWATAPSRIGDFLTINTPSTPPSRFFRLKESAAP